MKKKIKIKIMMLKIKMKIKIMMIKIKIKMKRFNNKHGHRTHTMRIMSTVMTCNDLKLQHNVNLVCILSLLPSLSLLP